MSSFFKIPLQDPLQGLLQNLLQGLLQDLLQYSAIASAAQRSFIFSWHLSPQMVKFY